MFFEFSDDETVASCLLNRFENFDRQSTIGEIILFLEQKLSLFKDDY